jgi:hypothetical protein
VVYSNQWSAVIGGHTILERLVCCITGAEISLLANNERKKVDGLTHPLNRLMGNVQELSGGLGRKDGEEIDNA